VALVALLDTMFDGSAVSMGVRGEVPSAAEALPLCSRVSVGSGPGPRTAIIFNGVDNNQAPPPASGVGVTRHPRKGAAR
jgi:hypothetical protein